MHHLHSYLLASFLAYQSELEKGFFKGRNRREQVKELFAVTHINRKLAFFPVTLDS